MELLSGMVVSLMRSLPCNLFSNKVPNSSTNEMYSCLNLLKVEDLHYLERGKSIFKSLYGEKFAPLRTLLDALGWQHQYGTKNPNTSRLPRVKTTRDKHDFLFQSILCWDALPSSVRNVLSFSTFSNSIKEILYTSIHN